MKASKNAQKCQTFPHLQMIYLGKSKSWAMPITHPLKTPVLNCLQVLMAGLQRLLRTLPSEATPSKSLCFKRCLDLHSDQLSFMAWIAFFFRSYLKWFNWFIKLFICHHHAFGEWATQHVDYGSQAHFGRQSSILSCKRVWRSQKFKISGLDIKRNWTF